MGWFTQGAGAFKPGEVISVCFTSACVVSQSGVEVRPLLCYRNLKVWRKASGGQNFRNAAN